MSAPRRCRLCGAQASAPALEVAERMFGTGERFAYERCDACGSLQLATVPADLARHYPPGYYAHGGAEGAPARARQALLLRLVLHAPAPLGALARLAGARHPIETHPLVALRHRLRPADRIADVGGGHGRLLRGLARLGFTDLTVVDPFAALEGVDEGVRFVRRPLAEVPGPFDVIMYHHALEHVPEPAAELRFAHDRLAPGGLLLVRVPWVPCEAFERYGAEWVQLDAPRHLTVPSRDGLRRAMRDAGLEPLGEGDDSTELQFWGSEAYRAGRTLARAAGEVSPQERRAGRARARELNARRRGDQGWMLARRPATGR